MIDLLGQGSVLVRELMMSLDKKSMGNLQENEVRKVHYVVNEKLKAFLKVNIMFCVIYDFRAKNIILSCYRSIIMLSLTFLFSIIT